MHPILVTGATGKTGNAVARQLLEGGHAVRAVVHRRDDRSEALNQLGAEPSSQISSTSTACAQRWTARTVHTSRYRSLHLERYARRMQFVAPQQTELALENRRWIAERSAPETERRMAVRAMPEHAAMRKASAA